MILGIDEAGRGPLAGPVVVAGVILNPHHPIHGLNDSKKLSEKKRNHLCEEILNHALAYHVVEVDIELIDRMNILQASLWGMKQVADVLKDKFNHIRVDGNQLPIWGYSSEAIIGGDAIHPEISAASILAKVYRDQVVIDYDLIYPEYEFAKHKGYGTKLHIEKIMKYGILPVHRKTFNPVKRMLAEENLD